MPLQSAYKNRSFLQYTQDTDLQSSAVPGEQMRLWLDARTWLTGFLIAAVTGTISGVVAFHASASAADDRRIVAALDEKYQGAVKTNDAKTMARILADDFVLVTGSGKTYTKTDMLNDARGDTTYDKNDEDYQTVRVWGDTAVVTARLWEKGATNGKPFDHKFWFSDTYVRTPSGWKYVFGQS